MIEQLRLLRIGFLLNPAKSRGQERLRRAGLTGITSMLSQGLVIATGFISVPLTVNYLGQERYGVWLTMNSLLTWLAISNLGFGGNALINFLAEANGKDDRELAQELVATAFWSLVGIAVLLAVIFALAFPLISWPAVFNATSTIPSPELHWAVIISMISFVLMFPISIVDAVYQSYQKGYVGNVWAMAGSLLSLVALIGVTRVRGGLPLLVFALSGVRLLVTLANTGYLFGRQYPWLAPLPQAVTRRSVRRLTSLGVKHMAAQLAGMGMFQSQPIIIAQTLGPVQVGIFNLTQRVLTLPLMVVQGFVFSLMPAYGEAEARQDWLWIRRTLKHSSLAAALVTVCMALCLAPFASSIVSFLAGPAMTPQPSLVFAVSFYAIVAGIVTPSSVMLYGLKRVGGQALGAAINAVATISLGIWLTRAWGLSGMGAAMAIALLAVNPIIQAMQIRTVFKKHSTFGS